MHGTGSHFYAPGVLETFSQQALSEGLAVVRINTRGHDGICSISGPRGALKGGATFENVADCRLDLAAWIEFLRERGYSRIALCGHSMGGVKSAYTMAHDAHPDVRAVILISSPRFHHQTFMQHPAAAAFRADFSTANRNVQEGRSHDLIAVTQPMPFLVTSAGFLDKYGPADSYDLIKLLPQVPCPALYVLGTQSPTQSIGFAGLIETLSVLTRDNSHIQLSLVDGANINYSELEYTPFERVMKWLLGPIFVPSDSTGT